jgi:hypothetical protein
MTARFLRLVGLFLLLGIPIASSAQIFRLQGGTSTIYGATGGSLDVQTPGSDTQIGAGFLDGHFEYGFLLRTNLFGDILSVGDDSVKVDLPTDIFDSSHYFLSRGIGLRHVDPKKKESWYAFAGTTSLGYSSGFFTASRSQDGLGMLYWDRQLSEKLRFVSRNLFSDRQTSIQSMEWSAKDGVKLSASAGIGSNQPYLATALRVDRQNLVVRAAYISEGDKFQRMQVPEPVSTEAERENIAVAYRIRRNLTVQGSHENILQAATPTDPILRASVNELNSTFNVAKIGFGAGLIESKFEDRSNLGLNFYGNRIINRVFSTNASFYISRPDTGKTTSTLTGTLREQLNQKLALTQTLIRSNGQTTGSLGGEIIGNRITAFVGYQTVYVPFNPDNAFQQALSFNARINLPRNLQLNAASFLDADGNLRYTVGLGSYLYRMAGMSGAGPSAQSFRFPKYVCEGIVVDANDHPLEGAALHIGGKLTYSDSEGRFMVRLDKVGPYPLVVALDEFTAAGLWEVAEAPTTAVGQLESEATPVRVVVRRVPARKAAAAPSPK